MRLKLLIILTVVPGNKFKIIYYLIISSLVIFWLTIVLSGSHFNHQQISTFVVQSKSMESVLPIGSLIIIKPQLTYQTGDIITFKLNDDPDKNSITHRIFKTIEWDEQTMFITKGDANTVVDSQLINQSEIIGKVIYRIPQLGMFIYVAQTNVGSFFYVIFPASIIILLELRNIIKTLKNRK